VSSSGSADPDPPARFYLDEDVPRGAAEVGRALGLDVGAARDVQRSLPQDDEVHLNSAAAAGRIMVTSNRNDFILATRDAFAAGLPHCGLLILTRKLPRDPARVAHALDRWVAARKADGSWPMQSFEIHFLSG
jgi:hypothetical protein